MLVFTKTGAGGTDKVWFYDMKADGFSLDDKRTEVKENDIPDIIALFQNLDAETDRKRTEQSFFVPKEEIAANGYDLSINKYKETEYVPVDIPRPRKFWPTCMSWKWRLPRVWQSWRRWCDGEVGRGLYDCIWFDTKNICYVLLGWQHQMDNTC